jgi:catechol 2,3-dioxygenase-like lactoylglutathione lyase family enzyme
MPSPVVGLHHVTAIASDPQPNLDFYRSVMGLRFVSKRLTNAPVRSGQCVMDSFHGRRVWSCGSSTWPPGDSASGCSVPEEWNGAKRVLSQSRNGFEHAGAASGEAGW